MMALSQTTIKSNMCVYVRVRVRVCVRALLMICNLYVINFRCVIYLINYRKRNFTFVLNFRSPDSSVCKETGYGHDCRGSIPRKGK
jgi:hypothetical protein